jgi:hypothetical protein
MKAKLWILQSETLLQIHMKNELTEKVNTTY